MRARLVNRGLIIFGAACLLFYGIVTVRTAQYQKEAQAEVKRLITVDSAPTNVSPTVAAARPLTTGELIGRVEIPRLKLSAAVAEGEDESTLGKAVGHLPDTPLPWQRTGNVAFAAHRDGLFRPLEHIRLEDDIRVVTPQGEFHYRVKRTHIVDPEDVWVVAPTAEPTLTLITCYPFSFVGNAPRRFVVQAELVGDIRGPVLTGKVVR